MTVAASGDFRPAFFDPLSTAELTAIICRKFEEQPSYDITTIPEFEGSGLYSIYYEGDSEALYLPLAPYKIPVYVGSAQSHNSATGRGVQQRRPLWTRVKQHGKSILEGGLDGSDFAVRLLLLPDVHIDLGENGLRVGYQPIWNSVLTGFGSHEQGPTTRKSKRSKWDTVHSGRSRSFGESNRDRDALLALAEAKIAEQVLAYQKRTDPDGA